MASQWMTWPTPLLTASLLGHSTDLILLGANEMSECARVRVCVCLLVVVVHDIRLVVGFCLIYILVPVLRTCLSPTIPKRNVYPSSRNLRAPPTQEFGTLHDVMNDITVDIDSSLVSK